MIHELAATPLADAARQVPRLAAPGGPGVIRERVGSALPTPPAQSQKACPDSVGPRVFNVSPGGM